MFNFHTGGNCTNGNPRGMYVLSALPIHKRLTAGLADAGRQDYNLCNSCDTEGAPWDSQTIRDA